MSPARPTPLHQWLYRLGVACMVLGLSVSALVYWLSLHQVDVPTSASEGKPYDAQVERLGGPFQLMLIHLDQWLGSLWHGSNLAFTLAFLSIAAALICFWLANLSAIDPPPRQPHDRH